MISPFNFHFVLLTALTLHMNQLFELSSGESKERTRKCYVITAMNNKIISNPDCLEFYSFIMCCKFQTPPPRSVVHSLNHVSFWRIETNFLWMHYEPKIKRLRKMHWKMNESPTFTRIQFFVESFNEFPHRTTYLNWKFSTFSEKENNSSSRGMLQSSSLFKDWFWVVLIKRNENVSGGRK